MEHISKPSEDVGEVVFGQPEERAGATEPDGSVLDRRKEDEWLEDTEPYHGARPRMTEVDRLVDDVLTRIGKFSKQTGPFQNKMEHIRWDRAEFQLSGQIGPEFTSGTANSTRRGGTDANTKGTRVTNRGDRGL